MKNHLLKFTRGYFSLFCIKITLFSIILALNACHEELSPKDNLDYLKSDLRESLFSNSAMFDKLVKANSFNDEIRSQARIEEFEELNIDQAQDLLDPILEKSKALLSYYGYGDSTFKEEYGNSDDYRVIIAAIGTMIIDDLKSKEPTSFNSVIWNNALHAQTDNLYVDCAIEVLGLNFGVGTLHDIAEEGIEKVIKSFIKKTAVKLLGPIGVAITVAHYSWCITHPD